MHRTLRIALFLSSIALLSGCRGPDGESLSGPASSEVSISVEAEDIRECLAALFPAPGLENAADKQFRNIERQLLEKGETEDAIDKTFDLILFMLTHFGNDRLEGTGEEVAACGNLLLAFVGLDPIFPTDGEFTAEICEAGEMCEVVTETKFAGLRATFLERTLVVIFRLPDDPGPFEAFGFDDFPLFFEINATSAASSNGSSLGLTPASEVPVAEGAVVGVCVVDPPDPFAPPEEVLPDLRLAHLIEGAEGPEVQILPLADADFLDCTGAATGTPPVEVASLSWWGDRARIAFEPVSEFLVAPLWASPGRLGGTISMFSPFGAVDQTSGGDDGGAEGGPTTTTLLLNGLEQNLTIFHGQTAPATAIVDPAPGNELEPTVNYFWPTFSGGISPTTTRFLDDGETTLEFLCDADGSLTPGPDVVEIGSGSRFVRAEFPGAGDFEASASGSLILSCLQTPG